MLFGCMVGRGRGVNLVDREHVREKGTLRFNSDSGKWYYGSPGVVTLREEI
jgi:hypothetical protein